MKRLIVLAVTLAAFTASSVSAQTPSDRARQYPYPQGSGSSTANTSQYPQGSGSQAGKQGQKEPTSGQQPKQQ